MTKLRLSQNHLNNLKTISDDEYFTISVCGSDFKINGSKLRFISSFLQTFFANSEESFIIECPSDYYCINRDSLIRSATQIFSLFENDTSCNSISVSNDDIESMKYFLHSIQSSSLLSNFDLKTNTISFHPFSLSDDSKLFRFIVCDQIFEIPFLSASLLSPKVSSLISNENIFELSIENPSPSHIESDTIIKTFSNIIQILIGLDFELNFDNYQNSILIFKILENEYFLSKTIEFVSTLKFESDIEKLFCLQQISNKIPHSLIESISSTFHSISEENILKIFPSILNEILQSSSLKIESEDSLFEILCHYLNQHPENYSIFDFIKFSSLSSNCLKRFFEIFPPFNISTCLWNSLSSLATKPSNSNRYIETIHKIDLPFESSGLKGVFGYLRTQCHNQNPHNSNLVKISSSTPVNTSTFASNLLDWGTSNCFCN
jgi:hypothetical protein